ncbi:hypothetical protein OEZ85_013220 [Tetradesmus obliquus]|uniref:Carbohydrate kinase PfkB domain-containing protein n=1 Tax=Tetradesmus obliquus TaxID=3088 RepID=A0ABY8U801_TETOB|nr:hypothetical protein OEZ85_013220 [Tetradesmus obliquus]WIA16548.1 hypothetical protein OEZ85_013220 [Tetradesmus obliquus]
MKRSGVCTKRVITLTGATGRSVVLLAGGERSCRTCLDPQVSFPGRCLQPQQLQGAAWLFVSGYAAYQDGLLLQAMRMAEQLGVRVALDLASWEVMASHWGAMQEALLSGCIDLCFCNQEEARQLCELQQLQPADPETALCYLLQHCSTAVVTLGPHGCLAGSTDSSITSSSRRSSRAGSSTVSDAEAAAAAAAQGCGAGGGEAALAGAVIHRQPGVAGVEVVDVTGAGDMFAAGFLHGMLRGWSLQRCAEAACLSGAAAVQVLGADVGRAQLHWMHKRLLGPHAAAALAEAAGQVAQEQLAAYGLVEKIGRGVVYFGSARVQPGSSIWQQTQQLARQVAQLLCSPTWTGGGPGLMQAASQGAAAAGGAVGGIRLQREAGTTVLSGTYLPDDAQREAGTTVLSGTYLPDDAQVVCRHLSTRKSGLVQAGCAAGPADRTAFIFLPGGLGTMDELFELLTLMQLKKLPQLKATAAAAPAAAAAAGGRDCLAATQDAHSNGSGVAAAAAAAAAAVPRGAAPVVLVDYDGFYQGFIQFVQGCEQHGMLRSEELKGVAVAASNAAVLQLLAEHYSLELPAELQQQAGAAPAAALLSSS